MTKAKFGDPGERFLTKDEEAELLRLARQVVRRIMKERPKELPGIRETARGLGVRMESAAYAALSRELIPWKD